MRGRSSSLALAFSFCSRARCVATATLMGFPSLKRSTGLWGKPIRTAAINFDKVELNYRRRRWALAFLPFHLAGAFSHLFLFFLVIRRGESKILASTPSFPSRFTRRKMSNVTFKKISLYISICIVKTITRDSILFFE